MFISQYEIDHRKEVAEGPTKVLYGRLALYYHLVDDVSDNPNKPPLQVCGTPALIAGVRGEAGAVPYYLDLAFLTQVEGIFILIENLAVESLSVEGSDEVKREISVVEFANKERIVNAVNAAQDQRESKPKRSHLSLVVDNENTVEKLIEEVSPSIELTQERLIELLQNYISTSLMPSSNVTHYRHHVPEAVKAEDDGDFLRQLAEKQHPGMFYRDALRKGEYYMVIPISGLTFVVGLKSHFTIVANNQGKYIDMGDKTFIVDRTRLMETIQSL